MLKFAFTFYFKYYYVKMMKKWMLLLLFYLSSSPLLVVVVVVVLSVLPMLVASSFIFSFRLFSICNMKICVLRIYYIVCALFRISISMEKSQQNCTNRTGEKKLSTLQNLKKKKEGKRIWIFDLWKFLFFSHRFSEWFRDR